MLELGFAMILAACGSAAAEAPLTIERLLADGWGIAGFASGYLILFRHPGENAGSVRSSL